MQLNGIHHLTAITANARAPPLSTPKRWPADGEETVNQDVSAAYHLFYADGIGSPGTDPPSSTGRGRERRGTIPSVGRISRGG